MSYKKIFLFLLLLTSTFFSSCDSKSGHSISDESENNLIIFGIRNDVDFFNPLYSNDITSGLINDLIFSGLTYAEFDSDSGKLIYYPNLAHSWKISSDKKSITYFLKTNLRWSDGKPFSSRDVKYSFYLYTNPEVMSVRQDVERFFIHKKDGNLDYDKSFLILSDSVIQFNFNNSVDDPLFITGLPILPDHIFSQIQPKELINHEINFKPIGIGPFILENYSRQHQFILKRNQKENYDKIPYIQKLVFKVIPNYNSRINQLKNGEIDFLTDICPEDAELLKSQSDKIEIKSIKGRDYDYIGWNNIDIQKFTESNHLIIQPHPLFWNKEIRRALTLAINRKEILDGYFGKYASLAESPISPIFKEFINDRLKTTPYDPEEAKRILEKNGWQDRDGDGIIDKDGTSFKFKLSISAGKPHREFAATMIKNYLKKIGIDVEIEILENSLFFSKMFERKLDAWIAGWTIPLDLDLEPFWGSDLEQNFFNVIGYQDKTIDKFFSELKRAKTTEEKKRIIYKIQEILQEDQPVTFLYWIDNIIGYSKKIKNVKLNPIAYTNRIWEWYLEK